VKPFRLLLLLVIALVGVFLLPSAQRGADAANPSSRTVNTTGPGVAWDGTALGGSSAGESACVESVNCDTYTLTVSGTAADWAGKVVDVRISWLCLRRLRPLHPQGLERWPDRCHSRQGARLTRTKRRRSTRRSKAPVRTRFMSSTSRCRRAVPRDGEGADQADRPDGDLSRRRYNVQPERDDEGAGCLTRRRAEQPD